MTKEEAIEILKDLSKNIVIDNSKIRFVDINYVEKYINMINVDNNKTTSNPIDITTIPTPNIIKTPYTPPNGYDPDWYKPYCTWTKDDSLNKITSTGSNIECHLSNNSSVPSKEDLEKFYEKVEVTNSSGDKWNAYYPKVKINTILKEN